MPRFHFHSHARDGVSCDEDGMELPDLESARACAIDGIRSIASEEVRSGRPDLEGRIEIVDDSGAILDTVRFPEAVEVLPPEEER